MKTFLKLFGWVMWKRKWWGVLILTMVIGAFTLEFLTPYFYKEFTTLFLQTPSDQTIEKGIFLLSLYVGVYAAQWFFWRINDFSMILFEAKGMRDIENWGFEIITKQNFDFFQNAFTGSLVKKVGKAARGYESILDWFLFSFLNIFLNLVVGCLLLVSQNITLGLLFLGWAIVYIIFAVSFSIWHLTFNEKTAKADSAMGGFLADAIGNISNIFAHASESFEQTKINTASEDLYQKRKIAWSLSFISFALQGILFMTIEIIALYIFYQTWKAGTFDIGLFVLFQAIYIPASTNLWTFGKSLRGLFYSISDIKEFEEILDATPPNNPNKTNTLTVSSGNIVFQNMNFGYPNTTPLFENFTLDIPAKKRIALVGHSGSGKSTLVKLLFDFISPQSGYISIDGQNIAEVENDSLRKSFSLVSQTSDLFHRSLRDNIAYDTDASDAEIWKAVQNAQCEDFIGNLPQKLETFVGERGVKLSGGERQRVALARAFLKNAPIVVLDEPTSALDSITEGKIQTAISKLLEGKTAIVIAHRLSTIFQMDIIVVLDHGKIIEMGSHEELLAKNGKYAQMWTHQRGGFLGDEE